MNSYLTGFYDTDQYLIKFLTIQSLILLPIISKSINTVLADLPVYKQLVELKDFKLCEKLRYCAQHGYVKIIKLYNRSQSISPTQLNELAAEASKCGQLNMLINLVQLGADIENDHVVLRASENGHLPIIKYFT